MAQAIIFMTSRLAKAGMQAGHKYAQRVPKSGGGWRYVYKYRGADRNVHAVHGQYIAHEGDDGKHVVTHSGSGAYQDDLTKPESKSLARHLNAHTSGYGDPKQAPPGMGRHIARWRSQEPSVNKSLIKSNGGERAGHKYLSRKPNAKGGFDYTYKHSFGGAVHVATAHEQTAGGQRRIAAQIHHDGAPAGEATGTYKRGGKLSIDERASKSDPSDPDEFRRIVKHAVHDTHNSLTVPQKAHPRWAPESSKKKTEPEHRFIAGSDDPVYQERKARGQERGEAAHSFEHHRKMAGYHEAKAKRHMDYADDFRSDPDDAVFQQSAKDHKTMARHHAGLGAKHLKQAKALHDLKKHGPWGDTLPKESDALAYGARAKGIPSYKKKS